MRGGRRALGLTLAACLAVLTACTQQSEQEGAVATAAPLDRFLTQDVAWQDCPASDEYLDEIPGDAECTTVDVPVDYADVDGERGTMQIALIRVPAQGDSKGSMLVNPGGPGGSGFDMVATGADDLRRTLPGYDIVGFDPRGVARSDGFDCGLGDDERLDYIEADFTPEDAVEFERVFAQTEAYEEACRAANPNWGFLGTASVARDVHVISRALGDPEINYFGISYGSVIGYELLRSYPDDIGRMILESVVDPAVEQGLADQLAAFNDQLEELLALCATEQYASCGRGRSTQEVRQAFISAANNVEDGGYATLTDNGQASESLVYHGAILPLYSEIDDELTGLYLDALDALINEKDASAFEFWGYLYNFYSYNDSKFTAADDIQGLVLCLDESETLADTDIAQERADDAAEVADIEQRAPLLAAIGFSGLYTGDDRAYQPCSYAQIAYEDPAIPDPLAEAAAVVNPGNVPVLLLAVTGDTATPYEWAQTISGELGVPLVSQDTTGHGVYSQTDNQCTLDIVATYLESGTLPAGPVTC